MRKSWLKFGISTLLAVMIVGGVFSGSIASNTGGNSHFFKKISYNKSTLNAANYLKGFETVTVNQIAFKKAADRGIVNIELFGKRFEMELHPTRIQSKDAVIIIENKSGKFKEKAPPVYTYRGKVKGIKDSRVTFTVSNDVVLGMIDIGNEYFVIDQTNRKYNGKVVHIVYTSNMIKKRKILEYNTDGIIRLKLSNSSTLSKIKSSVLNTDISSSTTVNLLAAYDTEFKNKFSNPTAEISSMIDSVNAPFSPADVTLHINDYKYYYNIQNSDACTVLYNFRASASGDRDSTNSDLAFLFSGKEFNGNGIGCAYEYDGNPNSGYGVAQMVSAGSGTSYEGSYNGRTILTAHEIGHNFGAGHEDNTNPNYARAYHWKYLYIWNRYTAMWSPFMGIGLVGGMQLEFSNRNNHGDSTHDNIRRISETKDTIARFQ